MGCPECHGRARAQRRAWSDGMVEGLDLRRPSIRHVPPQRQPRLPPDDWTGVGSSRFRPAHQDEPLEEPERAASRSRRSTLPRRPASRCGPVKCSRSATPGPPWRASPAASSRGGPSPFREGRARAFRSSWSHGATLVRPTGRPRADGRRGGVRWRAVGCNPHAGQVGSRCRADGPSAGARIVRRPVPTDARTITRRSSTRSPARRDASPPPVATSERQTTLRIDLPSCIRSKASFILSSGMECG